MNEQGDSNPLAFLHTEPLDISFHLFLNTVEKCCLNACDLGNIWVLGTQWDRSTMVRAPMELVIVCLEGESYRCRDCELWKYSPLSFDPVLTLGV